MQHISSHTLNEETDFLHKVFSNIQESIKSGLHYRKICKSFEDYYFMTQDAIKHYSKEEDFDSCLLFKNALDKFVEEIPKNLDEAIKYIISTSKIRDIEYFQNLDTFSLAINMHQPIGMLIMDIWLLRYDISPLRQYCVKKFETENADEIVNRILKIFIDTLKNTFEA